MEAEKTKGTMAKHMWGRMSALELPARIAGIVFVMVAIVAMSFCQLGFWSIGIIDDKPVYLLLLLGPLVMGALMFGPITGALLGLYAGIVVYVHARTIPLDFYELFFMTPLNSIVLLTVMGALSGLLFNLVLRRNPTGIARFGSIAFACVVLSFVASGLMMVGLLATYGGEASLDDISAYLFNSPLGVTVQALFDAVFMIILCCVVDILIQRLAARSGNQKLLSIFRNWMLLVSAIVFMLSSAIVFATATNLAEATAKTEMLSEADYLATQADSMDGSNYDVLLDGYTVELDGHVVILDKDGIIVATDDDEHFPVGKSFIELARIEDLAENDVDTNGQTQAELVLNPLIENADLWGIRAVDENGVQTMDYTFLAADDTKDGFTAILRPADMIYANRFGIMVAITLLAALLIAAVAFMATILLNRVVVRRIDETNTSLEKITEGDLNERVDVQDSHEFISLSKGINTTVSALKDTIHEVEQRNAQDLATAKAIQESALPRKFPPFPDIDRFDIYASMKTAKEVGGDFYDFFLIENSSEGTSKLGFVMADVSGKGIPAALFMMTAKTQIRNYMEAGLPVNEAIDAANHQLCDGNEAGVFVTAWVGVLDYDTGMLSFVNAGHNPPLLHHDGQWNWMRDVSGMPLGLFDGMPYDRYERQLAVGDMLYAYTDGVTEAMDVEGHLFGEDRLLETLDGHEGAKARIVCEEVGHAVADFAEGAVQSDDITMLSLHFGMPPE